MAEHVPAWRAILKFFGHTVIGLVLFALIAVPALGLDYLITQIMTRQWPISRPILLAVEALEYVILIFDLLLFLAYFGKKTLDTAKEFWSQ